MKKVFKDYFFNVQQDQMPLSPHCTIAYRNIPEKMFDLAWEDYQQKTFETGFTCNHFTLLKHNGTRWLPKQDFKLRAASQQTLFDNLIV